MFNAIKRFFWRGTKQKSIADEIAVEVERALCHPHPDINHPYLRDDRHFTTDELIDYLALACDEVETRTHAMYPDKAKVYLACVDVCVLATLIGARSKDEFGDVVMRARAAGL